MNLSHKQKTIRKHCGEEVKAVLNALIEESKFKASDYGSLWSLVMCSIEVLLLRNIISLKKEGE